MCGRYVTREDAAKERYWQHGWPRDDSARGIVRVLYNAAPTQWLPAVRVHPERGLEGARLRWGLIPSWSKDAGIAVKLINARGETIGEKPAFRAAFRRRRCVIPMMGFYEWKKTDSGKVPHYIHLLNAGIFGVAGLYEYWPGKDGAEPIESFAIVTTAANEMMLPLHDRMPAILAPEDHDAWLDPRNEDTAALQKLIRPCPADEMRAYPVSTRVNFANNDGPELIEPLPEAGKPS